MYLGSAGFEGSGLFEYLKIEVSEDAVVLRALNKDARNCLFCWRGVKGDKQKSAGVEIDVDVNEVETDEFVLSVVEVTIQNSTALTVPHTQYTQ